jgi:hypothetical protein
MEFMPQIWRCPAGFPWTKSWRKET